MPQNRFSGGKDSLSQLLGGRLLPEYRTAKETLLREMAFLARIAELADHRAKLEDGKPCPLCGAIEHPFAEGNVPVRDGTEDEIYVLTGLISKAEDQEAAIRNLEEAESLARANLTAAEKLESAAAGEKKAAENALTEVKDILDRLRADLAELRRAILTKLQPLGIADIPEANISSPIEALSARLNEWQAQNKKMADIANQISDIDREVTRRDAVIGTRSTILAEKLDRLATLQKKLTTGSDERNALYGEQNPDVEERRLNTAISDAEGAERQARRRDSDLQQEWNAAKTRVDFLKKRIDQRDPELRERETGFSAALAHLDFSDEEQFLAAVLSSECRAELAAAAKNLDERKTDLKARQNDRVARLDAEMARKITDKSLEELGRQFKDYEETMKDLRDIIAELKHQLSQNTDAKERIKEWQTAIAAQKRECSRWDNLHELIGSADGKKYRNFAQGLTFEMMIGHANRQLQKLTDRYLLARDDAQPLELNVIDNYQAGEIRSTKNLSGGESFIVSLSLALGLSHMASKNVRVDSLFLDEGFGSLDDEALETALDTLASLKKEGKLIGLISHVAALKERIGTQIQVAPQVGGRSQILGPGCSRCV